MPVCYFTYSWEKDPKKAEAVNMLLSYIKNQIETLSDGNITVIYDKESFEVGDNFKTREKQLKESDSVLLFFTPQYKHKVESKKDNGVYREYEILKERAMTELDGVIPILLSGSVSTAVTEEFSDIIFEDLSKYLYHITKSQGRIVLGDPLHALVTRIVRKAIKEAYAVSYCKGPVYQSMDEEFKYLFLDSDKTPLPRNCIIRTSAYDEIISQNACIVIGRKGSGKSTLLDALQKYNPDFFCNSYKKLLALNINAVDLTYVYDNLISISRKEFNLIPMTDLLHVFWELVFVLQGIVIISHELAEFRIDSNDKRYHIFMTMTNRLAQLLGIPEQKLYAGHGNRGICHCAVELLSNHIKNGNKMLANASEDTPLTAAYYSVNADIILSNAFGRDEFSFYCESLKSCRKKILFALDGFDTHTDDFRIATDRLIDSNPEEYRLRKDFDIRLFRELMFLVSTVKKDLLSTNMKKIYEAVHFCVILPQERFDEIALDDRDIAKRSYCSLNWDAHDLLEMLVKRLESYYRVKPNNIISMEERFYYVIRTYMPNIPTEITVKIDGHDMKFPLFTYLLRLSFWRPRDIIKNFAIITKLAKEPNDIHSFSESVIKKYLIKSSKEIIENEFLHEYQNVYLNLKDVLNRFKGMDIIQDYDMFMEHLSRISICVATKANYSSTNDKLMLLYRLGIIGLFFNKDTSDYSYGYHVCFSFNEGMSPMEDLFDQRISRAKIIFNPIFSKYLRLNYNTKELICNYSWEYILTNHLLKDVIRRV